MKKGARDKPPLIVLTVNCLVRGDDDLDPAVHLATLCRCVGGNRLVLAATDRADTLRGYAAVDQDRRDRLCTALGQIKVIGRIAFAIGVADDVNGGVRVAVDRACKRIDVVL